MPTIPSQTTFPAGTTEVPPMLANRATSTACAVSYDGGLWYRLPATDFPPIEFTRVRCAMRGVIASDAPTRVPHWARPNGPTKAIFVASSLEEAYSLSGMQTIARIAESHALPVTWLVGNTAYLDGNAAYFNRLHATYGDDVELENASNLYDSAARTLPWFAPAVSIEGAGHERDIPGALARGNDAFWGITWNSHGTDNTSDEGSPWGTYCADRSSYKRPSSNGDCSLLSFEWTARDLTRAYLTDTNTRGFSAEAAFSTDPDDILQRGGFDTAAGAAYARSLVDAYAAAGQVQPLVMVSQQEAMGQQAGGVTDDTVLDALYAQVGRDGMHPETMRRARIDAATFSAIPRAIAFPFIPGGEASSYDGASSLPATIDFHDDIAGMTFVSGHTLPSRIFEYASDPASRFNAILSMVGSSAPTYPLLTGVSFDRGSLRFSFRATRPMHFGIAIWSDPMALGISGPNLFAAGRAGAVVTFDLPVGSSTQAVPCAACTSTTFAFST